MPGNETNTIGARLNTPSEKSLLQTVHVLLFLNLETRLLFKQGWICSCAIVLDRLNAADVTSTTTAGEHQDISHGKWGTEMYGDNYFLRSSGLSWSLASNLRLTSPSSAYALLPGCANTFLFRHFLKTRKLNSQANFMPLIVPQNYGISGWLWSSEQRCGWILSEQTQTQFSRVFLSCLAQDYQWSNDGKQRQWQIVDATMPPHPSSEVQI